MYAVGYSEHEQSRYRFFPLYIAHTSAYFCYKSNRMWNEPKTLQKLLGHGTLQMTMDLYCHVTEDTLFLEMESSRKGVVECEMV